VQHKWGAIKPTAGTHRPKARLEKLLREKCRHDCTQNDGRDATEIPVQMEIRLAAKASAIQSAARNQMFCPIIS
jgi:hypothetical protein